MTLWTKMFRLTTQESFSSLQSISKQLVTIFQCLYITNNFFHQTFQRTKQPTPWNQQKQNQNDSFFSKLLLTFVPIEPWKGTLYPTQSHLNSIKSKPAVKQKLINHIKWTIDWKCFNSPHRIVQLFSIHFQATGHHIPMSIY